MQAMQAIWNAKTKGSKIIARFTTSHFMSIIARFNHKAPSVVKRAGKRSIDDSVRYLDPSGESKTPF
jgi:hypothetical protein